MTQRATRPLPIRSRCVGACLAIAGALLLSPVGHCRELAITAGQGTQPGSNQSNDTSGFEVGFYTYERSMRQHIKVGVAYTRLATDALTNSSLYAVSVYPELTFYPQIASRVRRRSPAWMEPYFFVRALGPSYISADKLGFRRQANNFAFLAQVGVGFAFDVGETQKANVSISWKHFSNANLFDPNDGIDVPFVIALGMQF